MIAKVSLQIARRPVASSSEPDAVLTMRCVSPSRFNHAAAATRTMAAAAPVHQDAFAIAARERCAGKRGSDKANESRPRQRRCEREDHDGHTTAYHESPCVGQCHIQAVEIVSRANVRARPHDHCQIAHPEADREDQPHRQLISIDEEPEGEARVDRARSISTTPFWALLRVGPAR